MEINNLPKYTDGKTNIYNWSEHTDGLPKGYYFSAIVTEGEITTLTNSYKPEETSVSVQKVWNDDGNRDGIRPESITVTAVCRGRRRCEASGRRGSLKRGKQLECNKIRPCKVCES